MVGTTAGVARMDDGRAGAITGFEGGSLLERDVGALALAWLRENQPQVEAWQVVGLADFSRAILHRVGIQSSLSGPQHRAKEPTGSLVERIEALIAEIEAASIRLASRPFLRHQTPD